MVKTELIEKSPLRILEKSIHGGLGTGNLGVVAARHGIGKTPCLVHMATDKLFHGKHVVHITFSTSTDHIDVYYEDIFKEISKNRKLENAMEVHDEIIKNRVIMKVDQSTGMNHVLDNLVSLIEDGKFDVDTIILDDYDFSASNEAEIALLKQFAEEKSLAVWFSTHFSEEAAGDVPKALEPMMDHIAVLIDLKSEGKSVVLKLVKDHGHPVNEDMHLMLDSTTLLIANQ